VLASSPGGTGRFGPPETLAEAGLIGPVTVVSTEARQTGTR
jgi:hypothetical protein